MGRSDDSRHRKLGAKFRLLEPRNDRVTQEYPSWDDPLSTAEISGVRGGVAGDLIELAAMIRDVHKGAARQIAMKDRIGVRIGGRTGSTYESHIHFEHGRAHHDSYEGVVCWQSQATLDPFRRALASARRLRPLLDVAPGTDEARGFYAELCEILAYKVEIQATGPVMRWAGTDGDVERLAATVIRWQRNLMLMQSKATPPIATYLFKKEGATWRINYEDHTTTVLDIKGVRYIHYLVTNGHKPIECLSIERACSGETPREGGKIDADEAAEHGLHGGMPDLNRLDRQDLSRTLAKVKSKKSEWERELAGTRDPAKRVELQEQIEMCDQYINRQVNNRGEMRPSGPLEESRQRVSKAINAAKRAITDSNGHIGEHFRAAVRAKGTSFAYQPDRDIAWVLG